MSKADRGRTNDDEAQAAGRKRPPIAGWKKLLLAISVLLMAAGGGLWTYAAVRGDDGASSVGAAGGTAGTAPLSPSGFAPAGSTPATGAGESGSGAGDLLEAWSPTIFRSGFSFFLGFCIGYAVRTFLKLSIVAIGFIALVAFGLQYAGVLHVDWNAIGGHFDSVTGWLQAQTASFTEFIQGHLPSAALAGFGLVVGFKKR